MVEARPRAYARGNGALWGNTIKARSLEESLGGDLVNATSCDAAHSCMFIGLHADKPSFWPCCRGVGVFVGSI